MIRLYVACEGQTEEAFVKHVVEPHLRSFNVTTCATIVGTPKTRASAPLSKGGGGWKRWHGDLSRLLQGPAVDLRVTTLFDLYGLPKEFPGLTEYAEIKDTAMRCDALERALNDRVDDRRFIPYLQRHEFEALVLGSLPALKLSLDADDDLEGVKRLMVQIGSCSPEDIDDGAKSAPSKRLQDNVPGYGKLVHGPSAVKATGLACLRLKCPRFDSWLKRLECLDGDQGL